MKRTALLISAIYACGFLFAEEVLIRRPLVVSPKRLDITPRSAPASAGANITAANSKTLVLHFRKGSMRLSNETQQKLLGVKAAGKRLLVTGYGDGLARGDRLANLRARAVASFLDEKCNITGLTIKWLRNAASEPGAGVILEETE